MEASLQCQNSESCRIVNGWHALRYSEGRVDAPTFGVPLSACHTYVMTNHQWLDSADDLVDDCYFFTVIRPTGDFSLTYSLPACRFSVPLVALIALVSGCSPSGPVMHEVTGKITFGGKPVKEGSITFEDPKTGASQRAELTTEGTYTIGLQDGNYQICIEPLMMERKSNADTPPDYAYKKADDIPQKYRSTAEAGLKHSVSGPGTYDLDMKR